MLSGALVAAAATAGPSFAAIAEFRATLFTRALYSQDIFRTGADAQHDFLATFGAGVDWHLTTARSTWQLTYTPQYSAYSRFDQLNHLDHQAQGSWRLQASRRTVFGVSQGYSLSNRQSTFHDFQGVVGDPANPVVPTTRRVNWDVTPFQTTELSRLWSLATEATYRSLTFSRPDLIDTRQIGLQTTLTARVGEDQRIGGRVRGDRFDYSEQAGTQGVAPLDRFLSAQFVWARERAGIFNWFTSGGYYQARGAGAPSLAKPTADVAGTWTFRASHLRLGYSLGYSASGGFGGSARNHSAEIDFSRQWGSGLEASVRGSYFRREPLDRTLPGAVDVEGGALDLQGVYRWRTGLGIQMTVDDVHQNRPGSPTLDYREAALGLVFSPARPARPTAPPPAAAAFARAAAPLRSGV